MSENTESDEDQIILKSDIMFNEDYEGIYQTDESTEASNSDETSDIPENLNLNSISQIHTHREIKAITRDIKILDIRLNGYLKSLRDEIQELREMIKETHRLLEVRLATNKRH